MSKAGHESVPAYRTYFSRISSEYVSGPRTTDTVLVPSQVLTLTAIGSESVITSPRFHSRSIQANFADTRLTSDRVPFTVIVACSHQFGMRRYSGNCTGLPGFKINSMRSEKG